MSRPLPIAVAGVGLFIISGATLFWRQVGFGWTAWSSTTSLTNDPSGPGVIVLDGLNVLAVLGVLAGVALIAGAAGFRLARRNPPRATDI